MMKLVNPTHMMNQTLHFVQYLMTFSIVSGKQHWIFAIFIVLGDQQRWDHETEYSIFHFPLVP